MVYVQIWGIGMISHKYQCIFVHVRKAAGTSIKKTFDDVPSHELNQYGGGLCSAAGWSLSDYYIRHYLKFTVIRNPWDRFVSGWLYCRSTKDRSIKDVLRRLPAPWEDSGIGKVGHDFRHVTRLQTDMIADENDHLVVDTLLRYERLQEDFDDLCHRLGKPKITLPVRKQNKSRGGYRGYFDDEALKLFREHFWRDIDLLGYDF